MIIRKAVSEDAENIRNVLVTTWHTTYKDFIPESIIEKITSEWHNIENIKKQTEYKSVLFNVAEEDNKILGIITVKNNGEGNYYLSRLYILPGNQSKGTGKKLLDNFIESENPKTITLEVEEKNEKGINFYKKNGFTEISRNEELIYGFLLKTVKMKKTKNFAFLNN